MKAPIYNEEQFQALFDHAATMQRPAMYRLMLLLSIRMGLRPMEVAGLQSSWFRGGELRIPLGYSKRKTGRSLPLSAEIVDALAAHMQGRVGPVFLNQHGEQFKAKGMSDAYARLYRETGIQGSCYSGRRSAATRMVEQGRNILVVQRFLGHSSPTTTMEYVEVSPRMLAAAMFA